LQLGQGIWRHRRALRGVQGCQTFGRLAQGWFAIHTPFLCSDWWSAEPGSGVRIKNSSRSTGSSCCTVRMSSSAAGRLLPAQIAARAPRRPAARTPLVFYPRRVREVVETHLKLASFYLYLHRIRRRVERDPSRYSDAVLAPIDSAPLPSRRKEKVLTSAVA